jgi:nitric oxide synthase oxygenase domain/subunit
MTISPIFPSTTEVFHQPMENVCLKPNLFFQSAAWHRENLSSLEQLGRQCPFRI